MGFLLFENQTSWLCWSESPDTIDWRPKTNCWRGGGNLGALGRLLCSVLRAHGYYAADPQYCWLICIMHTMFFLSSLHSQSAAVRNEHMYIIYIYIYIYVNSITHYITIDYILSLSGFTCSQSPGLAMTAMVIMFGTLMVRALRPLAKDHKELENVEPEATWMH